MTVFALADLHLSFSNPKPMNIFGCDWTEHPTKIADNWDRIVSPEDVVLVAGDISWAMKLNEAVPDLDFIAARPGRKVLIRGNHDYWWSRQQTNKIQRMVAPNTILLQGTSVVLDSIGIAGTRGWRLEDYELEGPAHGDLRIFERELIYLRRALETIPANVAAKIAMLHYPPFDLNLEPNEFHSILLEHGVDILVYGHVHKGTGSYLEGDVDGIRYLLTSADHIGFKPIKVI